MIGVFQGPPWVVDEKSTSQLGDSWSRSWRLRGQLTGYCFAARQYGIPVQGAIVRGISFLRTGAFGFAEPVEYRPNWQLERWWVQVNKDVARMVECWHEGYWDYDLAEACNSYGGCPFMSLCTVSNPNEWLNEYEYREWNPLDLNPAGRPKVVSSVFRS